MEHDDLEQQTQRIMQGLRTFGSNYTDLTRRFATSLNVHSTDAVALMEIFYAEDVQTPLTPARLAERIGLSSGATTALLNRLEEAQYVVRQRGHADRRMVTLHSGPNVRAAGMIFFKSLTDHMTEMCSQYSVAELVEIEKFLGHLDTTFKTIIDEAARPE